MGTEKPVADVRVMDKRGPPRTDVVLDKEAFGFKNKQVDRSGAEEKKETPASLTKSSGTPVF